MGVIVRKRAGAVLAAAVGLCVAASLPALSQGYAPMAMSAVMSKASGSTTSVAMSKTSAGTTSAVMTKAASARLRIPLQR